MYKVDELSEVKIENGIYKKKGNILDSKETYIAHQCNCITENPAGLSLEMFRKFPWADIYRERSSIKSRKDKPGNIIVKGNGKDERFVINMLAQNYPGKPKTYETLSMRKTWFKQCLTLIENYISKDISTKDISFINNEKKINLDSKNSLNIIESKEDDTKISMKEISSIAIPDNIGCGMAGGDWPTYLSMLEDFAASNTQIRVFIYKL
jgi:hypothetical protein